MSLPPRRLMTLEEAMRQPLDGRPGSIAAAMDASVRPSHAQGSVPTVRNEQSRRSIPDAPALDIRPMPTLASTLTDTMNRLDREIADALRLPPETMGLDTSSRPDQTAMTFMGMPVIIDPTVPDGTARVMASGNLHVTSLAQVEEIRRALLDGAEPGYSAEAVATKKDAPLQPGAAITGRRKVNLDEE